jgi:hypothetical protein
VGRVGEASMGCVMRLVPVVYQARSPGGGAHKDVDQDGIRNGADLHLVFRHERFESYDGSFTISG